MGYSVLQYVQNNTKSYCVIHQVEKYNQLRLTLSISACLLVFLISISSPTILVKLFERLYERMKKEGSNFQFFVWATVTVIFFLTLLIVAVNIMFWIDYVGSSSIFRTWYLASFITALIINIVTVLLGVAFVYKKFKNELVDFFVPQILLGLCCVYCCTGGRQSNESTDEQNKQDIDQAAGDGATPDRDSATSARVVQTLESEPQPAATLDGAEDGPGASDEVKQKPKQDAHGTGATPEIKVLATNITLGATTLTQQRDLDGTTSEDEDSKGCFRGKCTCCKLAVKVLLLFLASYFFTLFLVLISVHSVYIILGAVASPVVVLSHTAFYITAFVCLIIFMALFLTFTDKSKCDKLCQNICALKCRDFCKNCIQYIPPVVSGLLLIPCAFGFGLFYFFFTVMVEDYRHSGDLLSILGTFLPSALLAFVTFCGKKLIDFVILKKKVKEELPWHSLL